MGSVANISYIIKTNLGKSSESAFMSNGNQIFTYEAPSRRRRRS